jgi:hypothetical protein
MLPELRQPGAVRSLNLMFVLTMATAHHFAPLRDRHIAL